MTAKEYLMQLRTLNDRLELLEGKIARAEKDLCSLRSMAYDVDRVTGGQPVGFDDRVAALEDLRNKCYADWDALIDKRHEAEALIDALPNISCVKVLTLRYIECKDWKKINELMGFEDISGLYKLHGRALNLFQRVHLFLFNSTSLT